MKNIVTPALLILGLSACSSSSPSNGDIEDAIKNFMVAGGTYESRACQRISVENIEKNNGVKIDDNTYRIFATYDIRITPIDGFEEVENLTAERKTIEEEKLALFTKIREELSSRNIGGVPTTSEMPEDMQPLGARYDELGQLLREKDTEMHQSLDKLKTAWGDGKQDCSNSAVQILHFKPEDLATGAVKNMKQELVFVKTDNGWMTGR